MSVTEITEYRLRDESTFNPMVILELLKQICITCGHISGEKFKAYQEKEQHTIFYVVGGWPAKKDYESFFTSDTGTKLISLSNSIFHAPMTQIVNLRSALVTDIERPIISLEQFEVTNAKDFDSKFSASSEVLASVTGSNIAYGYVDTAEVSRFVLVCGWKTVLERTKTTADREDYKQHVASLADLVTNLSTKHLEVNQFI